MKIPEYINARWIATLGDDQLVKAEARLYTLFHRQESAEKARCGSRYVMLQGPTELVTAWQRWLLLNNETRDRGLNVRHAN